MLETVRCVCVNITCAWGHKWHFGTHLFISGSDTITPAPALSPHEPLTSITQHYQSYHLLFITKNGTAVSSLCSSPSPDLVWLSWCHESPRPMSQLSIIFRIQVFVFVHHYSNQSVKPGGEERDQWMAGPGPGAARAGLVWGLSLSLFTKPTIPIVPLSPARCKDVRMSSQH